jgi:tetratricopeptide (TPR) repeat protein
VLLLCVFASACIAAQAPAAANSGTSRILLVLPFENRSGQPSLDWVREAAPEVLDARLTAAGFSPVTRVDRLNALDHLGIPPNYQPTRASSIRLAQSLDVDSIVVGSYITNGTGLILEAQLIDVPHLRTSPTVSVHGEMTDLLTLFNQLAWRLTRQLDPSFPVTEQSFTALGTTPGGSLRLDGFEQYVRGITEPDSAERLTHLRSATLLCPNYSHAWMAIGRELYLSEQYDEAAAAFAHVQRSDPDFLEASFDRGVAQLFSGKYNEAEESFAAVARVLPLPEVINNQAVAESRRGADGTALFRRAVEGDPNFADFHFNLAVSLHRQKQTAEALTELKEYILQRPTDEDAADLLDAWQETKPAAKPAGKPETQPDPLERIDRIFNAAAFRQAAQTMDAMQSARRAQLSPRERALSLAAEGRSYLDRGLLLEAERLFHSALESDGSLPAAHIGLGEIRERNGDLDSAHAEAHTALQFESSAEAWLLLARTDLVRNRLNEATEEVGEALKLEPANRVAIELRSTIAQKQGKQ